MDSRTRQVTIKKEGKVVEQYLSVVSSDGNTITETGTGINSAGEEGEFSIV